jgi:hypothetical protein
MRAVEGLYDLHDKLNLICGVNNLLSFCLGKFDEEVVIDPAEGLSLKERLYTSEILLLLRNTQLL